MSYKPYKRYAQTVVPYKSWIPNMQVQVSTYLGDHLGWGYNFCADNFSAIRAMKANELKRAMGEIV